MSYILNALDRAEQERNRRNVPDLHTMQAPFPQRRASRAGYVVVGLLLTGAGAAAGWLQAHDGARGKSTPMQTEAGVALQRPQSVPAMPQPPVPAARDELAAQDDPPPMRNPAPKNEQRSSAIEKARVTATPRLAPSTSMPPRQQQVQESGELPAALQKELREMAISGFADSREAGRMAIVNGRVVVEGDELAGLTVERIAPGSLTLRYKDQRFRQAY